MFFPFREMEYKFHGIECTFHWAECIFHRQEQRISRREMTTLILYKVCMYCHGQKNKTLRGELYSKRI